MSRDFTDRKHEIKITNPVPVILAQYGVSIRGNRCKCFIRKCAKCGNDDSMVVKHEIVHCYRCNESWDVFQIVSHFENCSFYEAFKRLGGIEERPPKVKKEIKKKVAEYEHSVKIQSKYDMLLDKIMGLWCECDKAIILYAPSCEAEAVNPHPEFIKAIQRISYYEFLLDNFPIKLKKE